LSYIITTNGTKEGSREKILMPYNIWTTRKLMESLLPQNGFLGMERGQDTNSIGNASLSNIKFVTVTKTLSKADPTLKQNKNSPFLK
jgi:hypothetical protein